MKFQVMPPLSETDYEALKADIAERGVLIPIDVDEDGNVLDGHHRLAIATELGIDCPKFKRIGLGSDEDKRTHARALNIARRHLDSKQKRELIAAELKDDPERSNRQIGEALGVDHKTVASVRGEGEACGEIPHVSTVTDTAGRKQPSRKPTKTILIDDDDTVKDSAKAAKAKNTHVSKNSGENEWYTPDDILDRARAVLGGFDLDPASSAIANERVKAARFFTEEDDGLSLPWDAERIWMNPPYAQPLIAQFCSKFAEKLAVGGEGIALVNNATETAWFQDLASVADAICFPRGRIRFIDPNGEARGAPLQGQAVVYVGGNAEAFVSAFQDIGFVMLK